MKVLIADDDYLVREGLASAVDWEKYGFDTVYMAKNGLEVLATVELTPPDLIITDIGMPYMDGLELIEKLKAMGNEICIIIISGHNNNAYMKTAIHLNVFEYILKPINLNELKDAVYRAKVFINNNSKRSEDYYYSKVFNKPKSEYDSEVLLEMGDAAVNENLNDSDIKEFSKALEDGDFDKAMAEFEIVRQRFLKKEVCSKVMLQLVCNNFVLACKHEIEKRSGELEAIFESPIDTIKDMFTKPYIGDTFNALEKIICEMIDYIKVLSSKTQNSDIEKAKDYIQKNYSSMSISLNEVAKQVNMNPAYFSVLFKKDTGITFINYLTGLRIEKAKELLANSNAKIYEVAYEVGYDNPTYFSTVFKKMTKNSPQDYRKNKN